MSTQFTDLDTRAAQERKQAQEDALSGTLTLSHFNTLTFSFWTTGYMGGDAGHGGFLAIEIEDRGSTAMAASIDDGRIRSCSKVILQFRGDSELRLAPEGLQRIAARIEHALKFREAAS